MIVIVSLSASVKKTLFTKVLFELFSFKLAVTFVITLPPTEPSLNLGASFGVTIMCIVLFVAPLNVSVAVTSSSCAWILPLNVVLYDDDVAVSVSVITPPVETLTLSSVYADCVVNVIDCPSASVADILPTVEPLAKNSAIIN